MLRYIRGTSDFGIMYYPIADAKLIGYTDSDWEGSMKAHLVMHSVLVLEFFHGFQRNKILLLYLRQKQNMYLQHFELVKHYGCGKFSKTTVKNKMEEQ